jgi:ribose-phosphate pyrophosphokinase
VPITARLVAKLVGVSGADRALLLDLHAGQIQGFFDVPVDEMSAMSLTASYFAQKRLPDAVVVSPDLGNTKRARNFAEIVDAPLAIIEKRRAGNEDRTEVLNLIGSVQGMQAIIVDDEIDLGGTVLHAAELLLDEGATEVHAAVAHATLSRDASARVARSALRSLVTTDSVPIPADKLGDKLEVISVAPLFGEAIRRIHEGESVGALFDSASVQLPLRLAWGGRRQPSRDRAGSH